MSGACLGAAVAALVDGELDHAGREKALRHLAHCPACRAEVDAHRSLKARLARLNVDTPGPQEAFTDRLLALSVPGTDRIGAPRSTPGRPVTLRAPGGPSRATARPGGFRGPGRTARRRAAAGVAAAVLGVLTLALGSPQTAATTPVDPGTDAFVVQHVDTTSDVPRAVNASLTGDPGSPR